MIQNNSKFVTDSSSSKPLKNNNGKYYYYLIYDLWYVTTESILQVSIDKKYGIHSIEIKVHIEAILDFNVNWVIPESDPFVSRKYHGACQTYNHDIWTFGGLQTISQKERVYLNQLSYYDDDKNKWNTVTPESKIIPEPRYGLMLFCYYNYIILFGGVGENETYYGDLWVFDIVRSLWHKVLDSPTGYDMENEGEENMPINRAFYGGESLIKYGSVVIFGGRGEDDNVFWDAWRLDIEKVLNIVEEPMTVEVQNLWKRVYTLKYKNSLCRYGHDTVKVDDQNVLIFGGVVSKTNMRPLIFDVKTSKFKELRNENDPPENRFYHDMIDTGNKVVLLYGGENENSVMLSDYWMLRINIKSFTISYTQYKPKSTYFSMVFSVREGFSMHNSPRINHPIIIGGGFGNNEQGGALLSLPNIVWSSREEFNLGGWTPCPTNSFYNPKINNCEWCSVEQYFNEDPDDYFKSTCNFWPPGTIGSQSGRCTACLPGKIYNPEVKGSCSECNENQVWPIGSKYAFPRDQFGEKIDNIQYSNHPLMYKTDLSPFDTTSMWVMISIVLWVGTIFPILFCLTVNRHTRKYAIKMLKEADVNPITGGEKRLVVGGVITILYIILQIWLAGGFIAKYFLFNERIEATEITNVAHQNSLPESYIISITIYSSFIYEDPTSLLKNTDSIGPFNLCDMSIMKIGYSSYFSQAYNKNITWNRRSLSPFTDQFDIVIKLDELSLADPTGAYINVRFKSEQNRVFHFFKWQFKSIWSSSISSSNGWYSMAKSMMLPQKLYNNNLNFTASFRGPDPSIIALELTPAFYLDEIKASSLKGYRVQTLNLQKGSVINERTLTNLYTIDGQLSEDFSIRFETYLSSNIYNVRVIRLRTILDVLAQNLGLLAGLAFICRFAKFLLMKWNVWLHLDREYNMYFKEDKRLSVTLNPPNQKEQFNKDIDLWEPNYPYSNKKMIHDENGYPLSEPKPRNYDMGNNMHRRTTFSNSANRTPHSKIPYKQMEDEFDEENSEKNK